MTVIKDARTGLAATVIGEGRLRVSAITQTRDAFQAIKGNSYIISSDLALDGGYYVPAVSGSYLATVTNNSKTQYAIVTKLIVSADSSVVRFRVECDNTIGTLANNVVVNPFNDLKYEAIPTDLSIHFWTGVNTLDGISADGHYTLSAFLPDVPVQIDTNNSILLPPNRSINLWAAGNGTAKLSFAIRFLLEEQLDTVL